MVSIMNGEDAALIENIGHGFLLILSLLGIGALLFAASRKKEG